jgi:hypothetical protein
MSLGIREGATKTIEKFGVSYAGTVILADQPLGYKDVLAID